MKNAKKHSLISRIAGYAVSTVYMILNTKRGIGTSTVPVAAIHDSHFSFSRLSLRYHYYITKKHIVKGFVKNVCVNRSKSPRLRLSKRSRGEDHS